ncbi:MAG: autotransporter outer membrane beta-barrel domain-containing protein [Desulfobulbaceae bacterium]|nr:autotransporter outer membrane beta-barrel domain-containing protein [Desulfobulbaceae bacterium]
MDFNVHDVTNTGDADLDFIGGPQTITISRVGVTGSPAAGGVYLNSTGTIAALPEYPGSIFGSSAIFIRDVYSGAVTLDLKNVSGDVGIVAVTKGSVDFDANLLEAGKLRIEDVIEGDVTVDGGTFNFMPHGDYGASITGVNGDVTVGGNSDLNVVMGGPESGSSGGEVAFEIGDLTKKVIGDVDLKLNSITSTGEVEGRIAYIQDVVGKTTVAVAGDASNMYGGVSIMRNNGDVAVTLNDFHNKANTEVVSSDKNTVVYVEKTLSGNVTVNANDLVSNGFGVRVFDTALGNVNLTARDIDSLWTSMVATSTTTGDVNLIARDLTSIYSPGIVVANTTVGNVTATMHDVEGGNAGIVISNTLAGNVVVTAHNVTGRTFTPDVPLGYAAGDAIHISNTGGTTLLNLSGNVIGADSGVDILGQQGNVTINLDAGGSIGGLQGIAISLLSAAGTTNVINAHGDIFGALVGGDGDETFINDVTWLAGLGGGAATVGTLGGGNNRIVNNGVFGVGDLTANVGATSFVGGDTMGNVTVSNARFENNGLITLSNAHYAGGPTFTGDRLTINGDFVAGAGSKLVVDAALGGPGSAADLLTINGSMSGVTRLVVNNVTPAGGASNPAGIALIDVNGSVSLANVILDGGPIESGLFTYDLALTANGEGTASEFVLRSDGPSSVAATLPDLLSPAISVMLSSFDTWSDRQGDLRASFSRSSPSPRSTSVKPAGLTETANGEGPGMWGKGFASDISYDRSGVHPVGGSTFNHDTDFDQVLGGFLLGADHGSFFLPGNGILVVGAMGGYANADSDFNASGSKARFEGPVLGAYASYINNQFYVDAVVQADLLDMSATLGTAGSVSDVNANSFGARFETGYRFETGPIFIDPSVALSHISSSIDDISIPGANIQFENAESLTARSALRIGENFNMANDMAVTLSGTFGVNHELLDGFTATLSNGFADYGLTSSLPGTTCDAGIGLDIVKDNISFFGRSTAMFGNGLTGIGGKLGLSIRF